MTENKRKTGHKQPQQLSQDYSKVIALRHVRKQPQECIEGEFLDVEEDKNSVLIHTIPDCGIWPPK